MRIQYAENSSEGRMPAGAERLKSNEYFVNEIIASKIAIYQERHIECFSVHADITIYASCFRTEKCIEMITRQELRRKIILCEASRLFRFAP